MRNYIIYFSWIFLFCLSFLIGNDFFDVFFAVISFLALGFFVSSRSSINMMFFLGFSTFIFLPSILGWFYQGTDFTFYFLSAVVAFFFITFTKNMNTKIFIDYGASVRLIFVLFSVVIFCFVYVGVSVEYLFAVYIVIMSLSFRQNERVKNLIFLVIFLFTLTYYLIFSWSGYGRVVVMGWFILAILQYSYSINFRINKYAFALLPGLAASTLISRDVMSLKFSGFEAALNDSAYGPYLLASTFIDDFNNRGFDLLGFLDQVIFSLFIFIPRSIWPDKPFGFGFEYTVRHLDASLVDAGHSIASTLIGDYVYFLGYFGVVAAIFFYWVIACLAKFLYRINFLNGNGVLIFSASMMVLSWGGLTSFSARVILPIFIFIFFCLFVRIFLFKKLPLSRV